MVVWGAGGYEDNRRGGQRELKKRRREGREGKGDKWWGKSVGVMTCFFDFFFIYFFEFDFVNTIIVVLLFSIYHFYFLI